jgi:NADP-dependent 3-hydroxy acid dehydrogenase YdfG
MIGTKLDLCRAIEPSQSKESPMDNDQVVAFVTGANRGLGKQFASQLVARGAKVYAAARRPETIDVPGVVPVQLDITDPESVSQAATVAGDVNVLINNAGVSTGAAAHGVDG